MNCLRGLPLDFFCTVWFCVETYYFLKKFGKVRKLGGGSKGMEEKSNVRDRKKRKKVMFEIERKEEEKRVMFEPKRKKKEKSNVRDRAKKEEKSNVRDRERKKEKKVMFETEKKK